MTIQRIALTRSPYTKDQAHARMQALSSLPGCNECGNCGLKFRKGAKPYSLFIAAYVNTDTRKACQSEYLLCWPCWKRADMADPASLTRVKRKAEDAAHVLLSPRTTIDGEQYAVLSDDELPPPLSLVSKEEDHAHEI